jgi:hypothetical protein
MWEARRRPDPIWFYQQVKGGGPWDYKLHGTYGEYEAFGNFNYGATGFVLGIPHWLLVRAAGAYQAIKGPRIPNSGSPSGQWPYGDERKDQANIELGIAYAKLCD